MPKKCDLSTLETKSLPKLIVGSAEECADLLYASGFNAPDDFLYYETGEEKGIVVSPLEYARAVSEAAPGLRVIDRTQYFGDEQISAPASVLLSRRLKIDCWQAPARFPFAEAEILRRAGIDLHCAPGRSFFPQREIKTKRELAAIQQSETATEEIMRTFRQILINATVNARGFLEYRGQVLTSEFLRAELEGEFKRMGYSAFRTIFSHGIQCAEPHHIGSGPVRAGETVVADIFPRSDVTGYWGDMTRTYVKGKAPAVVKRAFNAVLDAFNAAKKMLRAGVTGAEVHNRAAVVLREAGFATGRSSDGKPCGFFHGLGHGVGLEIHEEPRLSPLNRQPLQAGNVVSVEPGLYYSGWGGVRLEDLVSVTTDGYHSFNTMDMELELP